MISVIVTFCEHDERFLERCLASVEWQLADGDELIVIGDGVYRDVTYLDRSKAFISCHQKRTGVSYSRNVGAAMTHNAWLKFLDVDDLLAPFALESLRRALPSTDAAAVIGGQFIVHNGVLAGLRKPDPTHLQQLKVANPFVLSPAVIRRSALEAVGGFDERIHFEEDWDLWLKLSRAGFTFGFLPIPICYYTIDDQRRAEADARRDHNVEGIDVREYFKRTYGCRPELAA